MPAQPNQRILIRGVNWLGDAVMTTPALMRLREARPNAHITLLTPAKLRDLWRAHPAVDETIAFENGEGILSVARRLRKGNFDIGLVLPNSPRSALELWLAGIPQRIGVRRPWRNFFLTRAIAPHPGIVPMHKRSPAEIKRLNAAGPAEKRATPGAHHIHQYLQLTTALGANPEPVAPVLGLAGDAVRQFTEKFKLDPGATWFGLNAGAEYGPAKRWPEERFIAAAIEIQRQTNCRWLIFGLQAETAMAERIANSIQQSAGGNTGANPVALSLAGATTLGELCAALKSCRVLLTNDSGPMHVASALGTPVVVPFGSTSPEVTGPGLPGDSRHQILRTDVPCSPCFLRECPIDFRCMTSISVESVVTAVMRTI